MNAFTAKPKPPAWLKELDRNQRTSLTMQKIISNPSPTQIKELSLKTDFRNAKRLQPTPGRKS